MSPSSYFAHLLDPVAHQRALLPSLSSLAKCRPQPSRIPRSHLEFQLTAGNQMEEPAGAACTLAIASIFEQGSVDWSHRSMNTTPSGHCSWVKKRLAGLPLPISSISVHFSLVMNQICRSCMSRAMVFRRKPKTEKHGSCNRCLNDGGPPMFAINEVSSSICAEVARLELCPATSTGFTTETLPQPLRRALFEGLGRLLLSCMKAV